MIWIADDIGSKELEPYFKPYDVQVQKTDLPYADFVFYGEGIDGPCSIGIERKTIGFYTTEDGKGRMGTDLISSIRSKRMSGHQLKGLFGDEEHGGEEAGFDYVIFLLEGIWKVGDQGEIVVPSRSGWIPIRHGSRPVLYRELVSHLMTLQFVCGGYVERTGGPAESAAWMVALYKWFQKGFKEHKSHQQIYAPEPVRRRGRRGVFTTPKVGPVACVAAQMPGVDRKAFEFEKAFKSVRGMVNAPVNELMKVEGIGKKGAEKIDRWLDGKA